MPIAEFTISTSRNPDRERWYKIRQRCLNPNDAAYRDYGGRGIQICIGWSTFDAFYRDMGARPSWRHSLDREDNNGHYSCGKCSECIANGWPLNCRWATPLEQSNNRRMNVRLTKNGKTLTLTEWAKEMGVSMGTLTSRHARGYSSDEILAPVKKRRVLPRKPRRI